MPIAEPLAETAAGLSFRPALLIAALGGLVFAGAAGLWLHYGTAVFFETIRAGFMACF